MNSYRPQGAAPTMCLKFFTGLGVCAYLIFNENPNFSRHTSDEKNKDKCDRCNHQRTQSGP